MKPFENILTTIAALFFGLIAFIGLVVIGYFFYDTFSGFWGVLASLIIILLGLYVGYDVFITVKRRGVAEFSSRIHASPELNNLDPHPDSKTKKLSIDEFMNKYKNSDNHFLGGRIKIWGDFKSRELDSFNKIEKIEYLDTQRIIITFDSGNKLTVWNPKIIFQAPTFLKILNSNRIKWEWVDTKTGKKHFFDYRLINDKIVTETNSDWKSYEIDTLLSHPALLLVNW